MKGLARIVWRGAAGICRAAARHSLFGAGVFAHAADRFEARAKAR